MYLSIIGKKKKKTEFALELHSVKTIVHERKRKYRIVRERTNDRRSIEQKRALPSSRCSVFLLSGSSRLLPTTGIHRIAPFPRVTTINEEFSTRILQLSGR